MCYAEIESLINKYWLNADLNTITDEIVQHAIGVLIVKYREKNYPSYDFPEESSNKFPDGLSVVDAAQLIIDAAQKIVDFKKSFNSSILHNENRNSK